MALLGYGTGGRIFHGPLLRAEPGLTVTAVVTRGPGAAAEAARRDFPAAELLHGAERVWERGAEFDLAVVTTPNRSHVPLATAALRAGLGVVVDKPMAATAAEGRELGRLAAERGQLLSVFHNRRWDGDFRTVRELVERGELGRVLRLESRFERWRPEPRAGSWRETGGAEEVSGHLYDLGTHLVDQAVQILGPVRTGYAERDARRSAPIGRKCRAGTSSHPRRPHRARTDAARMAAGLPAEPREDPAEIAQRRAASAAYLANHPWESA